MLFVIVFLLLLLVIFSGLTIFVTKIFLAAVLAVIIAGLITGVRSRG